MLQKCFTLRMRKYGLFSNGANSAIFSARSVQHFTLHVTTALHVDGKNSRGENWGVAESAGKCFQTARDSAVVFC